TATCSSSPWPTPRNTSKPPSMAPTTAPSTLTAARDTRWSKALTGHSSCLGRFRAVTCRSEQRSLLPGVDYQVGLLGRQLVERALEQLHVLPHQPLRRSALAAGVAQQVGGVEQRHHLQPMPLVPGPADPGDAAAARQEVLGRDVTQGGDDLRPDQAQLLQ